MRKLKVLGAMLIIAAGTFTAIASNSSSTPTTAGLPGPSCKCADIYQPVMICTTGELFKNRCEAYCAGYTIEDICVCPGCW